MAVWNIFVISSVLLIANYVYGATVEYGFENSNDWSLFTKPSTSTVTVSTTRYKNGSHSIKWTYESEDVLSLDVSAKAITSISFGGIKFWIYNEESMASKCFTVRINTTETTSSSSCSDIRHTTNFYIKSEFIGWRGVWIAYNEFKDCPGPYPSKPSGCSYNNKKVTAMEIKAPRITGRKTVYIDALRFYDRIRRQSRDKFVPSPRQNSQTPPTCLTCSTLNTLTVDDALKEFPRSQYWQQTYRWGAIFNVPPAITTHPPSVLADKISDINLIEKRLDNWFADEKKTYIKLTLPSGSSPPGGVDTNFFVQKRWKDLTNNIDQAYVAFRGLAITKRASVITGSPLYTHFSEYGKSRAAGGDKQFGHVMHKVLLPLALEYYLKSRELEVNNTICQWATTFSSGTTPASSNANLELVTGKDAVMKSYFTNAYTAHTGSLTPPCTGADQTSYNKVKEALTQLNNKRKQNLLLLLDYLEDQGWTEGSAAGSTNHAMNHCGAGFANAVFVLRDILRTAGKLDPLVATLKWYTDFNEIYQTNYEYAGTTADRMRTILLFRLMTVLMMPDSDDTKKQAKVRAMEEWKRWYDNALTINTGMGGVIKPDFTGYHHNGFYGQAYVPHALHAASIARFLIEGTRFALPDDTSKKNLKNALDVMKIVSVKYSTPNSVSGRFPGYSRAILTTTVPAFAYFAVNPPSFQPVNPPVLGDLGSLTSQADAQAFLRLYNHGSTNDCNTDMRKYLCLGKFGSKIRYYNSIGSLQIMQNVTAKAVHRSYSAENSPVGNWAKNFAALSIHRREDWAVTVKGFNKFIWDTETTARENVFGLYQSHGALQISNSEDDLERYDIAHGWDWRKIPGTTTVGFDIDELDTNNNRRLQPKGLAGGVTFSGVDPYSVGSANGAFGMDLKKPEYDLPAGSKMLGLDFKFKKSVFFKDDFLVCLGSNIDTGGVTASEKTYTTLFQTKVLPSDSFRSSTSTFFRCGDTTLSKTSNSWRVNNVQLEDALGNRYFVKNPDRALYFESKNSQTSYPPNGTTSRVTTGDYCTAWFDHGTNRVSGDYEYTVQIKGRSAIAGNLGPSDYRILKRDENVHAVKIEKDSASRPTFGYVVFRTTSGQLPQHQGLIHKIQSGPAIVMARKMNTMTNKWAISVSSPDLNLGRASTKPSWCPTAGTISGLPNKATKFDDEYKFCASSQDEEVIVMLRLSGSTTSYTVTDIFVNGDKQTVSNLEDNEYLKVSNRKKRRLRFKSLKNGFTTEIWVQP